MCINSKNRSGFTLLELLIVIGILAILAVAIVLVLNPAEFMRQSRDAKRINDLKIINTAINLILVNSGGSIDWDGQNFSDTCSGQSNQKIYVSVPSDNGEVAPPLPPGWSWSQVVATSSYRIDGYGWLPINFGVGGGGLGSAFPVLPIDPTNTFASGKYFTYVCDPELTASFESSKFKSGMLNDGGDDAISYEVGSRLTITPPVRDIPTTCDNYGDVNMNNEIDPSDVNLIQDFASGWQTPTAEQNLRANVNQDNVVDGLDAQMVSDYFEGLVTVFPACQKLSPCNHYGDVNGNWYVNLKDLDLITKHIAGSIVLTPEQKERADVNNDGALIAGGGDQLLLSQFIVGIRTTFPAVCL